MNSLDAQISGLEAQFAQAQTDLTRAEDLFSRGTVPKTTLDQARTAFNVASNALKARTAERSVIQQQVAEGKVLAPTAGRVMNVPVTTGTVILPGDTVATVAEQNFILRLRVPERHARFLKAGDPVRIDGEELGAERRAIRHHQAWSIRRSRTAASIADATVAGLGDYFVGERIRVWVSAGERDRHRRAGHFIVTRFGIDYARLRQADGERSTCRCSADANCRARTCRTRWKSSPALRAATCWCSRESRTVGASDAGDDPLAADAAVPAGGARGRPDRADDHPARGRAADQRADGRHPRERRRPEGAGRGRTGDQAAGSHHQGHRRRRACLQPDAVDDRVMVTARFLVGTKSDDAILRVHEKIRANLDRIPVGIPEPLIVGRGINDVAVVVLTLSPKPDAAARWTDKDLYELADQLRSELVKTDNVGLTYISGGNPEQIRVEPDPEKLALFGVTLQQLVAKVRDANRSFQAG